MLIDTNLVATHDEAKTEYFRGESFFPESSIKPLSSFLTQRDQRTRTRFGEEEDSLMTEESFGDSVREPEFQIVK